MTTRNNVFNLILGNIEVMNETLVTIGECLAMCAEKLIAIEVGTEEDLSQLKQELEDQQASTAKALDDIRKLIDQLKKKK